MRPAYVLLIFVSLSLAATVEISGAVTPSGSASMAIKAEIPDGWERPVCLNISGPIRGALVKDRSGLELEYRLLSQGNRTLVCATVPSDYIEFDISSDSFTTKAAGLWDFDFLFGMSENVSSLSASLRLPPGATVKSTNGAVGSQGGSLAISWRGSSLDTSHQAHLRAGYELAEESFDIMPFALAALVLAAIAAYGLYRVRSMKWPAPASTRNPPSQSPPVQSPVPPPALESNAVFKTLDETDKDIIREIAKQGGKTTQAHLYLNTHIPKATLSRRLASLENRGIIISSQKGNRNLITLADIVQK